MSDENCVCRAEEGDPYLAGGTQVLLFDTTDNNFFVGRTGPLPTGTGQSNHGFGFGVFENLTDGGGNCAFGLNALQSATTASDNSAFGANALKSATYVIGCTAVGRSSQESNETGTNCTSVGDTALKLNTESSAHVAIGYGTARDHITGNYCVAVGAFAMRFHITGAQNTSVGMNSMGTSLQGARNTCLGFQALYASNGDESVAVGVNSLASATGGPNTALGYRAGVALVEGAGNIFVGHLAGESAGQKTDAVNTIVIGDGVVSTADNQTIIGNDNTQATVLRGTVQPDALQLPVYAFANLPAPSAGLRAFVSDANAPAFGDVVVGGGSIFTPVFSDGVDWRVG